MKAKVLSKRTQQNAIQALQLILQLSERNSYGQYYHAVNELAGRALQEARISPFQPYKIKLKGGAK